MYDEIQRKSLTETNSNTNIRIALKTANCKFKQTIVQRFQQSKDKLWENNNNILTELSEFEKLSEVWKH